jgi:2-hydroxychromene-2-carboxylate isomerase
MLARMTQIPVAYYADPSCPFGYSAVPAVRAIDWRYGDQLDWSLHLIGLAEETASMEAQGFTPLMLAQFQSNFARWGMPFDKTPKTRLSASSPACRAIVAVKLDAPGREYAALRALQLGNFTDGVLLDEPADIERALSGVAGIDAAAIVARIEDEDVWAAYRADLAATRSAAGTAGAKQGKTGFDGDQERFSAPSLVFELDGRSFDAGGMQPVEAYDVLITNLDPSIERAAPAGHAREVIDRFPEGVVTQEVALIMAKGNDVPDRDAAERQLQELVAEGYVTHTLAGNDAIWAKAAA